MFEKKSIKYVSRNRYGILLIKIRNKSLHLSFDLQYISCDLKKKKEVLSKAAV